MATLEIREFENVFAAAKHEWQYRGNEAQFCFCGAESFIRVFFQLIDEVCSLAQLIFEETESGSFSGIELLEFFVCIHIMLRVRRIREVQS